MLRTVGMILLIVGLLASILFTCLPLRMTGEVAGAFIAASSAGVIMAFFGGLLLWRKPEGSGKTHRKASEKREVSPKEPRERSGCVSDEERRLAEARERERQRQDDVRRWREENRKLAEGIARLESMKPFCICATRPSVPEEDELDGVNDQTGVAWLRLMDGADLREAVKFYEACSALKSAGRIPFDVVDLTLWGILFFCGRKNLLIMSSAQPAEALGEELGAVLERCRALDLHPVVQTADGRYRDLVEDIVYRVEITDRYPGSADDAATYGVMELFTERP